MLWRSLQRSCTREPVRAELGTSHDGVCGGTETTQNTSDTSRTHRASDSRTDASYPALSAWRWSLPAWRCPEERWPRSGTCPRRSESLCAIAPSHPWSPRGRETTLNDTGDTCTSLNDFQLSKIQFWLFCTIEFVWKIWPFLCNYELISCNSDLFAQLSLYLTIITFFTQLSLYLPILTFLQFWPFCASKFIAHNSDIFCTIVFISSNFELFSCHWVYPSKFWPFSHNCKFKSHNSLFPSKFWPFFLHNSNFSQNSEILTCNCKI